MKRLFFLIFLIPFLETNPFSQGRGSLLVVNKADNTVSIIDFNKSEQVAVIQTGDGPHEVAVSLDGKIAAVTNYGNEVPGNSLTIIDMVRQVGVKEISLGEFERPHGIEFINDRELLVTCERQSALVKVNVRTNKVSLVAKTGEKIGHMVAISPKGRYAYVANIVSGTVSKIDIKKNELLDNINVKKGIEGIAITPNGKEIWVANRADSTVIVMDSKSHKKLASLPAHKVAFRVKVLADGKHAVVSNGESGNLSVYDVRKKKWLKDIDLHNVDGKLTGDERVKPPIPVGIATGPNSEYVFVACANYKLVAIVDTKRWEVLTTIEVGNVPDGLYYSQI